MCLRYYLKNIMSTETLVPDEMASDLLRECQTSFLSLNSSEVASQLTLQDFQLFKSIEPTEYVDELFELDSKYGSPHLSEFSHVSVKRCPKMNLLQYLKHVKHNRLSVGQVY